MRLLYLRKGKWIWIYHASGRPPNDGVSQNTFVESRGTPDWQVWKRGEEIWALIGFGVCWFELLVRSWAWGWGYLEKDSKLKPWTTEAKMALKSDMTTTTQRCIHRALYISSPSSGHFISCFVTLSHSIQNVLFECENHRADIPSFDPQSSICNSLSFNPRIFNLVLEFGSTGLDLIEGNLSSKDHMKLSLLKQSS